MTYCQGNNRRYLNQQKERDNDNQKEKSITNFLRNDDNLEGDIEPGWINSIWGTNDFALETQNWGKMDGEYTILYVR